MNKFLVNHYWETVDFIDKNQEVIDKIHRYVNNLINEEYDISLGSYSSLKRELLNKVLKKEFKSEDLAKNVASVLMSDVDKSSMWRLSFSDEFSNTTSTMRLNRILHDMLGSNMDYTQYDEEYETDRYITLKYYTSKKYTPLSEIRKDLGFDDNVPERIVRKEFENYLRSPDVNSYMREKYIQQWPLPEREKNVIGKKFIESLNKDSSPKVRESKSSNAQSFIDSFSTYGSNEGSSSNYGGIL